MNDRGAREAVLHLVKAVDNLSRGLTIVRQEISEPVSHLDSLTAEKEIQSCRQNLQLAIDALNKLHA